MIDPHVHVRDWAQREKETIAHAAALAWRVGLSGLFEMPNTDPPLTTGDAIVRRIADADAALEAASVPLFHGLYGGITADPRQLAEVVAAHAKLFPRVVGLKLYAGHSTGNMGVVTAGEQERVWNTLGRLNYRGVVAVHAETEALLEPHRWDPAHPISHGHARPPAAEEHSVAQQIRLATAAGFQGALHICHVTTPEALELIVATRGHLSFHVRVGVTPHHLILNESVASRSAIPEWRVNPPLRDVARVRNLRERLYNGEIDWIESDHAPHTWKDKCDGAAGLPGIPAFRVIRDRLRIDLGVRRAHELCHSAVVDAFGIDPDLFPANPHAGGHWDYNSAAAEYPWNPYRFVDTEDPFRDTEATPPA
ncbi:MAG: dihydroorotase [Spirochaeta sp.]|jgi:dihydroorotase|nr:dihydroorotase [Spirochaeta sp.]